MKKALLFFYSAFLILHSSFAQNPLVKQWDYRYGGLDDDEVSCILQTSDGGYILGGSTSSDVGGDKIQPNWVGSEDYWIVKLDSLGNKQWDGDFGGTDIEMLNSVYQTADGGYILGGWSQSGISGDKTEPLKGTVGSDRDYWIIKIDSLGIRQWDKDFGGTDDDELYSVQQTADGGFILGGYSGSGIGVDKSPPSWGSADYWMIKTDSLGNKEWDKDFGGTGFDVLTSLQQTADRGFILGGFSASGISGDKTQATWNNSTDFWIVKTDSLGIKQWDKDFGGTADDEIYSLCQTRDGGYIAGGLSASGIGGDKTESLWGGLDCWIIKMDSLGIKQWDKDFGGTNNEDFFGNISQTADGGYLLCSTSYSNISGSKTENNYLGVEQTWIVKINSFGNRQWDKTILCPGHDEQGYAIQTKDGCYAIVSEDDGNIGGYKTQNAWNGNTDYWIVKFCDTSYCAAATPTLTQVGDTLFANANYVSYQWYYGSVPISGATTHIYIATQSGNYNIEVTDSNGCSAGAGIINVIAGNSQLSKVQHQLSIIPNPFTDKITLHFSSAQNEKAEMKVFNAVGEIVYQTTFIICQTSNINLSFLPCGIYFLTVQTGKKFYREKVVKY